MDEFAVAGVRPPSVDPSACSVGTTLSPDPLTRRKRGRGNSTGPKTVLARNCIETQNSQDVFLVEKPP